MGIKTEDEDTVLIECYSPFFFPFFLLLFVFSPYLLYPPFSSSVLTEASRAGMITHHPLFPSLCLFFQSIHVYSILFLPITNPTVAAPLFVRLP
ncbi:uncharacterized protein GGS25DRAFT_467667 [Hypoxylon fragiforme]|uniref:uncharacterized protein n=1 Tax=Hypoxylon fragiforme TaxID=63214 RepID=UPI0020C634E2|nr:uncharacterized protein GGS25DRAFT_467667 [Hypoxylon fragiforme]KAI2613543.1 hypothetical protein GGS25DRAFT_467667 [Hypoxylon fragiforme]